MEFNRSVDISQLPKANIGRSVFDLSSDLWTTANSGSLIPIFARDVLPGDSFKIETSFLARLQTLLTPVMSQIYLDQYWFYVPNRLVFSHFEEMMGENKTGHWIQPVEYLEPVALTDENISGAPYPDRKSFPAKSIADYFGYPTGVNFNCDLTDPILLIVRLLYLFVLIVLFGTNFLEMRTYRILF